MHERRLSGNTRSQLGRAVLALFLLLTVAELTARVLFSNESLVGRLRALGPHARLVATLVDYAHEEPSLRIVGQEWHPRFGWTNRAGAHLGQPNLHINRQRLRSTHDVARDRRSKARRIAIFGDSFVFGIDVGDEETYAAQLETLLGDTEVLNFGVPGYGLDQCLLRWREEGAAYNPDVVVLGVMDLLFRRSSRAFDTWYKPYFELQDNALLLRGVPVPGPEDVYRRYLWRPRLFDLLWILQEARVPEPPGPPTDENLDIRLLTEVVLDIRRHRARPILALHPAFKASESVSPSPFHRVCATTEVECLDLIPEFESRYAKGEDLAAGTHWNAAGHAIVARALARHLAASGS